MVNGQRMEVSGFNVFDKDAVTKKRFKVKGSKTGRTYIIDKKGKKHYNMGQKSTELVRIGKILFPINIL